MRRGRLGGDGGFFRGGERRPGAAGAGRGFGSGRESCNWKSRPVRAAAPSNSAGRASSSCLARQTVSLSPSNL